MTTPMTPDIEAVATGLTEAQRKAVVYGQCAVPRGKEEYSADCICMSALAHNLIDLGLAYPRERYPGGIVRTPFGEEVRKHLMEGGKP